METVTRNISELSAPDRLALEHVVGHSLDESQQIIIQIVDAKTAKEISMQPFNGTLPSWCNVYSGLGDQDLAEIEEVVLQRANFARSGE